MDEENIQTATHTSPSNPNTMPYAPSQFEFDSFQFEFDSFTTVNAKEYYKLVEKARKWDNLMKLLEVK